MGQIPFKVEIFVNTVVSAATPIDALRKVTAIVSSAWEDTEEQDAWPGWQNTKVEVSPHWDRSEDEPCQVPGCTYLSTGPGVGLCSLHLVCPNCGNLYIPPDELHPDSQQSTLDLESFYKDEDPKCYCEVLCYRCGFEASTDKDSLVEPVLAFLSKILRTPTLPIGRTVRAAKKGEAVIITMDDFGSTKSVVADEDLEENQWVRRTSYITNGVMAYK